MIYVFIIAVLIAGWYIFRVLDRRRIRRSLLNSPLDNYERAIELDHVPIISRLPDDLRQKLEGKINLFLYQVEFSGYNGIEVTEEMELSIAAQACLLVMNSDQWYDHLSSVLVYPSAFKSKKQEHDGYVVREREVWRIGESWSRGPVVLSWRHVEEGAADDTDGRNVVLHEFAHQLDVLSGHTDGAPVLAKGQSFADWERVFLTSFEAHKRNVERGQLSVLDAYGATAVEEFFAVAIEAFFETPARLRDEEPEIYGHLSMLLNFDPVTWG